MKTATVQTPTGRAEVAEVADPEEVEELSAAGVGAPSIRQLAKRGGRSRGGAGRAF